MDDGTLRDRYRRLTQARVASPGAPEVPLETIQALAEDRLEGAERLEALDRVLADPTARTEYEFLRELAAAGPRPAVRTRRWLVAAAVLVVVGGGLLWRASMPAGPEPMRGPGSSVTLIGPAEGETVTPGSRLVWRPVAGAVDYQIEVLTPEGAVAFEAQTADTTVLLSVQEGRSFPSGPALWSVLANLGGGAVRRATPRRIVLGR